MKEGCARQMRSRGAFVWSILGIALNNYRFKCFINYNACSQWSRNCAFFVFYIFYLFSGVCTNATAPSVSSINRILRNRAAERAAAEFARAAGYGLYAPPPPYAAFPWAAPSWGPALQLPRAPPSPPNAHHLHRDASSFLSSPSSGLIGKYRFGKSAFLYIEGWINLKWIF